MVFLSAEASIVPLPSFEKYARTKREAEEFLKNLCPDTDAVVIRPGLVYSQNEREWSVLLAGVANASSALCSQQPRATNLSSLTDLVVKNLRENLNSDQKEQTRLYRVIGAN